MAGGGGASVQRQHRAGIRQRDNGRRHAGGGQHQRAPHGNRAHPNGMTLTEHHRNLTPLRPSRVRRTSMKESRLSISSRFALNAYFQNALWSLHEDFLSTDFKGPGDGVQDAHSLSGHCHGALWEILRELFL